MARPPGGGGQVTLNENWEKLVPGLWRLLNYQTGSAGTRDLQDIFLKRQVPVSPSLVPIISTENFPVAFNAIQMKLPNQSLFENRDKDPRMQLSATSSKWFFELKSNSVSLTESSPIVDQMLNSIGITMRFTHLVQSPGLTRASGSCRARLSAQEEVEMNCHWIWIDLETEKRSISVFFGEITGSKSPHLFGLSTDLPPFSSLLETK